jgi:sirohydrochlorin ferrochelatase
LPAGHVPGCWRQLEYKRVVRADRQFSKLLKDPAVTRTPSVTIPERPPQLGGDPTATGTQGLVVVGHGTLDVLGKAEFFETVGQIARQLPGWVIEPAFLEMAAPDVVLAIERTVERGAQQVHVLPLLLFAAGHAKLDLPRILESVIPQYAGVSFALRPVLNCQSDLVALSALRFCEVVNRQPGYDADDTLLLLVGRGSNDPEATQELFRFAALRGQRTPLGGIEACFLAMCEPSLEVALARAANSAFRRVVVQPHLLFHGALYDRVVAAVSQLAGQSSDKAWIGVGPLGPHPLLVSAALQAARLAANSA